MMSIELLFSCAACAVVAGWFCYRWGRADEAADTVAKNAGRVDANLSEGGGGPTPEK